MKTNEWVIVIAVIVIVAVLASFLTLNLTGNAILGKDDSKKVTLYEGKSQEIVLGAYTYKVYLAKVSQNSATVELSKKNTNDNAQKEIMQGDTKRVLDVDILVSDVSYSVKEKTRNRAKLTLTAIPETSVTYQGVLDMLNSCEVIRTGSGVCGPVCSSHNKTCIFGDAIFKYSLGNVSNTITQIVSCYEQDVQAVVDLYTKAGYTVQDVDAGCVCCKY